MPENRRYPEIILNRERFSGRCIQLTVRFGFKAAKLQNRLIDPAHFRIPNPVSTSSSSSSMMHWPCSQAATTLLARDDRLFHYLRQVHIALIRRSAISR